MSLILVILSLFFALSCGSDKAKSVDGGEAGGADGEEDVEEETEPDGGLSGSPTSSFARATAGLGEIAQSENYLAFVKPTSIILRGAAGETYSLADPVLEAGIESILEE